jgi:hypothetical protein
MFTNIAKFTGRVLISLVFAAAMLDVLVSPDRQASFLVYRFNLFHEHYYAALQQLKLHDLIVLIVSMSKTPSIVKANLASIVHATAGFQLFFAIGILLGDKFIVRGAIIFVLFTSLILHNPFVMLKQLGPDSRLRSPT